MNFFGAVLFHAHKGMWERYFDHQNRNLARFTIFGGTESDRTPDSFRDAEVPPHLVIRVNLKGF